MMFDFALNNRVWRQDLVTGYIKIAFRMPDTPTFEEAIAEHNARIHEGWFPKTPMEES